MSVLFSIFLSAILLTDFVRGFIEPFGYGGYPRQFGMNNFGFPPLSPGGPSSWNPYFSAQMLPMNGGFNARANFGFGQPNFAGYGNSPMDMIAPPPFFPSYPNNNNNGYGNNNNNNFGGIPSNYGYGNNQWPYYPNNNNNGFTQRPIIPTLPSSAINSNYIITTTTTPTVSITSFLK